MDLGTVNVDMGEARERFQAYRAAEKKRALDPVEQSILRGYRAICAGHAVIDLRKTMQMAGLYENGLPRLAIVQADMPWVWCFCEWNGGGKRVVFSQKNWADDQRWFVRKRVRLPKGTFSSEQMGKLDRATNGGKKRAKVPYVPPEYRPARHLRNYHILWEADWEDYPVDPVLLKHISGVLYKVVAEWDLTELERAVLRATL